MQGETCRNNTVKTLIILLAISLAVRLVIFIIVLPYNGILPSTFPDLEPYQDFKLLYMSEVGRFLNGSRPYIDFFHAYPPLFLYTLSIPALIHLPTWVSATPIVAFDALTIVPVFLLVRRLLDKKWASIISLTASLTPMVLWYDSALWLNPPPPTFLMLMSSYLFLTGRSKWAALALGLATGYKQTSITFFPVMLLAAYRAGSKRRAAVFATIYVAVCIAVSLPYIIQYPTVYLWAIGVPGIPTPPMYGPPSTTWSYDISTPINVVTYIGIFGFTDLAVSLRNPLWIVLIASFILLIWRVARRREIGEVDLIVYLLYSIILFDTFFPRGIYKYFLNTAIPFLALLLYKRKHIPLFIIYGLTILVAPRFITPWLTLLLITLTPYLHWNREQTKYLRFDTLQPTPTAKLETAGKTEPYLSCILDKSLKKQLV